MLEANLKQQLKQYLENLREPIELVASLGRGQEVRRHTRIARRNRRAERQGQREFRRQRRPQAQLHHPPRQRSTEMGPLCRPAAGPRIHLAGAGPAVGGRPPAQGGEGRAGPDRTPGRRFRFRDVFLAVLPQLPRRRAGADADGALQPAHQRHADRGRHLSGRGRGARRDGRARHLPEWRDVRQRQDGRRGNPRQDRQRRRRQGAPRRSPARSRSKC